MTDILWPLVSRVFAFVALGVVAGRWLAGGRGETAARWFTRIALGGLVPFFVFTALWTSAVPGAAVVRIVVVALCVLACGAAIAFVWTRGTGASLRARGLPVIFMNSAYLAIPINTVLWGAEGAAYTIVFNMVTTIVHFTAGVWLVSARDAAREILSLPVFYAIIAGLLLNIGGVPVPGPLAGAGRATASFTLMVMLVFVGYRVAHLRIGAVRAALPAVLLRMGGGFCSAAAAVWLLGLTGTAAGVCLMTASMPAALTSYLLAERYDRDAPFVAAAIVAGIAVSVVTVPLVALFAR